MLCGLPKKRLCGSMFHQGLKSCLFGARGSDPAREKGLFHPGTVLHVEERADGLAPCKERDREKDHFHIVGVALFSSYLCFAVVFCLRLERRNSANETKKGGIGCEAREGQQHQTFWRGGSTGRAHRYVRRDGREPRPSRRYLWIQQTGFDRHAQRRGRSAQEEGRRA